MTGHMRSIGENSFDDRSIHCDGSDRILGIQERLDAIWNCQNKSDKGVDPPR